ncbi:MAG: redoxin domain-containing protein [Paludibaculum sp.]
MSRCTAFVLLSLAAAALAFGEEDTHRTLAIGSPAPNFSLPGIDGKTHQLSDYASSPILAIVFTCNHCPTAQLYEGRIKQLVSDYSGKGVTFVAIQPNAADAVRLNELGYTDVGDTFEDMKIRAAYRQFNFAYLNDGETRLSPRPTDPRPRRTSSSSMPSASCAMKAASTTASANRW